MTEFAGYLEDVRPGDTFTSVGRTITESDIQSFAGLSGDFNPLHTDAEWVAENTPFSGRIAHGLLILSIGSGIRTPGIDALRILAYLEVSRKMVAPVYPGDTIRVTQRVEQVRQSRSRLDTGIVTLTVETRNQHDELVQSGTDSLLVERKGSQR